MSELEEVVVVGEVAYTRSRDSLSVSPLAGGEENRLAGDRMTIYRKQPDGGWLLARDANVLSPVQGWQEVEGEAPAREVCFMTANDFRELAHVLQRIPGSPHTRRLGA